MVDVELLGEFAMIVLRDCEACKSVSQEMLDSLHRSGENASVKLLIN
jgi:hypothetical protein